MNVTRTWNQMADGTPVYVFTPGATTRHDGMVRDCVVYNNPNDDYCVGFGAALMLGGHRFNLMGDSVVFDSREERDAVAKQHAEAAAAVRDVYYSPEARAARDAKLLKRDRAREAAAIRREMLSE